MNIDDMVLRWWHLWILITWYCGGASLDIGPKVLDMESSIFIPLLTNGGEKYYVYLM